jgi:hypothetical protein
MGRVLDRGPFRIGAAITANHSGVRWSIGVIFIFWEELVPFIIAHPATGFAVEPALVVHVTSKPERVQFGHVSPSPSIFHNGPSSRKDPSTIRSGAVSVVDANKGFSAFKKYPL